MQDQNAYKTVIADLVAKRTEIDRAIKMLRHLISNANVNNSGGKMTTMEAVKRVLSDSDVPMTINEIVQSIERSGFSNVGKPAVSTVLSRLKKVGAAMSVNRGLWELSEPEMGVTSASENEPFSEQPQTSPESSFPAL